MNDDLLAQQFDENRARLRAIAYRMLGSATDADDAVQEAWLRLDRSDAASIENLPGWLTTVTARLCLNMLRARRNKGEEPFEAYVPDPIVERVDALEPEHEAVLSDSVGLALLVVLDALTPSERLAFVLHDMFAVPFEDIARMIERSPDAARQLASRARRRVRGATVGDVDAARQREVVDAFFAAARGGDFDALVSLLDPGVVLRSDGGRARPYATAIVRGAAEVAGRAIMFSDPEATLHPARVNGGAGVVIVQDEVLSTVMAFTVAAGKIRAIDVLADPERLATIDLGALDA
jgi:RNA polymerase sigma-70 factor (ECF subfamily)